MERVRELRELRMLSQQELADRAGVSLFTIQRIERGEGSVRPKTGRAVSSALGVGVEELLPKAQAPLPFEEPAELVPAERRVLKLLGACKALAGRVASRVEALLTDVVEEGKEPPRGVVGTLLRDYCDLDDVVRAQLPEFLDDLSLPHAEYELAMETWEALDRIEAGLRRVNAKLGKNSSELDQRRRRRAEQGPAREEDRKQAAG